MKVIKTRIRNKSVKADYAKIHVESGLPMIESIEKICLWIIDEGEKEGNATIPEDIYEEADNLLAINENAWKRL